jgi:transcriptional regulator with XRE-family HTH domain
MGILRLKEILKEKEITGKDLAEKINISVTGMSNIVKGQSLPREEVLLQIAETLDVDLKELFISTKKKREPKTELQSIINQLEVLKSDL